MIGLLLEVACGQSIVVGMAGSGMALAWAVVTVYSSGYNAFNFSNDLL